MGGCFLFWIARTLSAGETLAPGQELIFAEGKWDPARWQAVAVPPQAAPEPLVQKTDGIATRAFRPEETKQRLDNALLVLDTGRKTGEYAITFSMDSTAGTAPGVVLWPVVDAGELRGGIAVFVASYTMAVWRIGYDAREKVVTYTHLVRLGRYQDPAVRHVLRFRTNAKGTVSLQIDDSDFVILRQQEVEPNPRIGIWGCHGVCTFHALRAAAKPSLPFGGVSKPRDPEPESP